MHSFGLAPANSDPATAATARIPRQRMPDAVRPAMPDAVREALYRISLGMDLESGMLRHAFDTIAALRDTRLGDPMLAALMTGVMAKGPSVPDLVELLTAALDMDPRPRTHVPEVDGHPVVVLAGSGKKGIKSFNITTPSAIVAAAVGAAVVKMGSHATSSNMGSRDLARTIGLPECHTDTHILASLRRHRFAFVPIEESIPTLNRVYGNRFFVINPFSFGLAALASPVRGRVTVYGLAHPRLQQSAQVLARLGTTDAAVIGSVDDAGYWADEFGLGTASMACRLRGGDVGAVERFDTASLAFLGAGDIDGRTGPRDGRGGAMSAVEALAGRGPSANILIIALNAGVFLREAGIAVDLEDGYALAKAAIDSGRALALLNRIRGAHR